MSAAYYSLQGNDPRQLLKSAIEEANNKVYQFGRATPSAHNAGSTVTAAVVVNGQAYVANVGDSRTYIYRTNTGRLEQISKDHSLTQQKIDQGILHPSQARQDPDGNIITRSIGAQPMVQVDIFGPISLNPGDTLLLCSDGLTDMLEDHDVVQILSHHQIKPAVQRFIKDANRRGGHDNISVVLGRVPGGPAIAQETILGLPKQLVRPIGLAVVGLAAILLVVAGIYLISDRRSTSTPPSIASGVSPTTQSIMPAPPENTAADEKGLSMSPTSTRVSIVEPTSTLIPTLIVVPATKTSSGSSNLSTPGAPKNIPLPNIVLVSPQNNANLTGRTVRFQWKIDSPLPWR